MEELIEKLIKQGYLKTPLIIEAFRAIKRKDFVPESLKSEADINAPLPIGCGQTISQPLTVAFMLELLQPRPGERILDIGAGSGWQTALLAYCVGSPPAGGGKVFAVERIPELVTFGRENVAKYNFLKKGIVKFVEVDASKGLEEQAPFDKIIAAASAEKIPKEWKEQLRFRGRIVTPVKNSIWLLIKNPLRQPADGGRKKFDQREFPGFAFVPLVS